MGKFIISGLIQLTKERGPPESSLNIFAILDSWPCSLQRVVRASSSSEVCYSEGMT